MSVYADEGTIAHALAAMCLNEGRDAAAYIGRIIEAEDYEHSKLSPSNAARWMRCPGSLAMENREPFKPRKFSMPVVDEMAEGVQIYLDNIRQYADGKHLMVEVKVDLSEVIGVPGHSGTSDTVILDFDQAEVQVHDLKFGKGVLVDAEKNEQLQLYGLGALKLVEQFAPDGGWRRFRGVIHQPRIDPRPSEWSCSIEELVKFGERAKERAFHAMNVAQNEKPEAIEHHLVPGEKQCLFCNAKARCPKVAQAAMMDVLSDFEELTPEGVANAITPVEVPTDNALLAALYAKLPLIEDWCKAIAARAEAELLAGRPLPGFKLVAGRRGNRAWRDDAAAEALMKSFRLKQEQMYSFKLISPAQAEKVLKDAPKRWAKLLDHITQSDGKPSVAPETDSRPAIVVTPVADEFTDLSEEELV